MGLFADDQIQAKSLGRNTSWLVASLLPSLQETSDVSLITWLRKALSARFLHLEVRFRSLSNNLGVILWLSYSPTVFHPVG